MKQAEQVDKKSVPNYLLNTKADLFFISYVNAVIKLGQQLCNKGFKQKHCTRTNLGILKITTS
jgi:hypothetical protein